MTYNVAPRPRLVTEASVTIHKLSVGCVQCLRNWWVDLFIGRLGSGGREGGGGRG